MGRDWERKKKPEKFYGKGLRSEDMLRKKASEDREERPVLTGYKPVKADVPAFRETVRLESSHGTLAFGGNEKKELALLASEKRHAGGPGGTDRERLLREKGERSRPFGENKRTFNPGGEKEGAAALILRPHLTKSQMLDQMRRYGEEKKQETFNRMTPFLVGREDLERKRGLEEAVREARRQSGGRRPEALDRQLDEEKQELIRKRQMESRFGQTLEKAAREEKQTVWEEKKERRRLWEMLAAALDETTPEGAEPDPEELSGQPEDTAEQPEERN